MFWQVSRLVILHEEAEDGNAMPDLARPVQMVKLAVDNLVKVLHFAHSFTHYLNKKHVNKYKLKITNCVFFFLCNGFFLVKGLVQGRRVILLKASSHTHNKYFHLTIFFFFLCISFGIDIACLWPLTTVLDFALYVGFEV